MLADQKVESMAAQSAGKWVAWMADLTAVMMAGKMAE